MIEQVKNETSGKWGKSENDRMLVEWEREKEVKIKDTLRRRVSQCTSNSYIEWSREFCFTGGWKAEYESKPWPKSTLSRMSRQETRVKRKTHHRREGESIECQVPHWFWWQWFVIRTRQGEESIAKATGDRSKECEKQQTRQDEIDKQRTIRERWG